MKSNPNGIPAKGENKNLNVATKNTLENAAQFINYIFSP
jgi:hypothetical protein